jgi:hypothetical protein
LDDGPKADLEKFWSDSKTIKWIRPLQWDLVMYAHAAGFLIEGSKGDNQNWLYAATATF